MDYKFLAVAICVLGSICDSSRAQDTLLHKVILPGTPTFATHSTEVAIGKDKEGKYKLTWTTTRNTTGCLQVSSVRLEPRTPARGLIKEMSFHQLPGGCVLAWESNDPTRFEVGFVRVDYEEKGFLSSYSFRGSVATIYGNGQSPDVQ